MMGSKCESQLRPERERVEKVDTNLSTRSHLMACYIICMELIIITILLYSFVWNSEHASSNPTNGILEVELIDESHLMQLIKTLTNERNRREISETPAVHFKIKYLPASSQIEGDPDENHTGTISDPEHGNENGSPKILRVRRASKKQDSASKKQDSASKKRDSASKKQDAGKYLKIIKSLQTSKKQYSASKKQDAVKYLKFIKNLQEAIEKNSEIWKKNSKKRCQVPRVKTAEILCNQFARTKVCISFCTFGTTFPEGIQRTHVCSKELGAWKKPFAECKPFVDCNVRLISPGTLNCTYNKVKEHPNCDISCKRYEDKEALKTERFYCKSDGTWKPPLPHCVALKGTLLTKAPKVTEHGDLYYPKNQEEPKDIPRSRNQPWKWTKSK